jgi:hypothetical protein
LAAFFKRTNNSSKIQFAFGMINDAAAGTGQLGRVRREPAGMATGINRINMLSPNFNPDFVFILLIS